jgi:hypothetical protein
MVLAAGGCAPPKRELTVPLEYRVDSSLSPRTALPTTTGLRLFLEVSDDRAEKDKIGENIEDTTPKPIHAGAMAAPAEFVKDAVTRELTGLGMLVVGEDAKANRTLRLHLIKFYCVETSTYDADIRVNAEVSEGGRVLWSALVLGDKRNFGRSLSAQNYQEVFSGAVQDMVSKIVGDSGFQKAVSVEAR